MVVDQAPHELPNALEQSVEIEDRGQLAADLVHHRQRLRLPGHAGVEPRILDRLRDARGGHGEQLQVLGLEVVGLLRLDVDDPDEPVLDDQWHGQLRAHRRVHVDVVRVLKDVVDQDGLARLRDLADDAFAHLDLQPFCLGAVPDLEAHAQVVGAVVEQQNGEDAVVDHRAHQAGGAVQQRLQVEGGVERVGEAQQEFALQRLDAHLRRGRRQVGAGPVVPLEGMGSGPRGGALGGRDLGAANFFGHKVLVFPQTQIGCGCSRLVIISRRGTVYGAPSSRTMATLALAPIRFAPDSSMARA